VGTRVTKWLSWAVRRGVQRGLLDGDQFWLVVGAMALLLQLGLRVYRKKPHVVFSGPVPVGETLLVAHFERERHNGRRGRKGLLAEP
jgi:hypothetical protein